MAASDAQPPVFVLTMARSGSTLLRFILDSHPDLACPPETNVGQVCFGLARLWDILEPSPESAAGDHAPGHIPVHLPDEAATSIRGAVDGAYRAYLASHDKIRWCDKSLDSPRMAELLASLYPDAQFVCLYRHCMDTVVSAVEAAPWGLSGYGLDQYVSDTPANLVLAVARCWLDQTRAIIEFQGNYPDRCHGIRYEDLVTSPEQVAAELFKFLEVAPAPGISEMCLALEHETRGPSDHKIWFTTSINARSLGQGARVPVTMLPPEFLSSLNEALDLLGYRQVNDTWATDPGFLDPRADIPPDLAADGHDDDAEAVAAAISGQIGCITDERSRDFAERWPRAASRTLCLAVETAVRGAGAQRCWGVTCADSPVTLFTIDEPPAGAMTLSGPPRAWMDVLGGRLNLATGLRAGKLRLLATDTGPEEQMARQEAMHLLAHLLNLAGAREASQA